MRHWRIPSVITLPADALLTGDTTPVPGSGVDARKLFGCETLADGVEIGETGMVLNSVDNREVERVRRLVAGVFILPLIAD